MHRTAKISGIISTIMVVLGISMKLIHFPGGSILVILGVGVFSSVCLTTSMFYKRKTAVTQLERVEAGLSWFAGSLPAVGLLFAVQHWPGGPSLLIGILLSVIFLVIHFINVSKYESERKKFGIFDVLIVVMFGMLFIGRNSAVGRTIETQKKIEECKASLIEISEQEKINQADYAQLISDTANREKADTVRLMQEATEEIINYINDLRGTLIAYENGTVRKIADTTSIRFIQKPSDYDVSTHFMIGSDPDNITGEAKPLYNKIFKYFDELEADLPNRQSKKEFRELVHPLLPDHTTVIDKNGSMTSVSWHIGTFYHKTIIETLTALQQVELNILKAEDEAFKQIQKSITK